MSISIKSGLRIQNDSRLLAENFWEWSVWIEGPDDEVREVVSVTYYLHPTFPTPVRVVRDRATNFRLTTMGWGEFTISADARLEGGQVVRIERWIELQDEQGRRQTDPKGAAGRRPTVFVSHSVVDTGFVQNLREALDRQGVEVTTADSFDADNYLSSALTSRLKESDMLVAVVSTPPSSFVEQEVRAARSLGRPVFSIVLGKAPVPKLLLELKRFELGERQNVTVIADRIAATVKDLTVSDDESADS